MKKRGLLSALIAAAVISLSSCSALTGDLTGMLTPPTLSSGREALTRAIHAAVGESYELVYPQAGSYRTGIISVDLTGNGQTEAVCFYKPTATGGKLSFLVMENRAGEWVQLAKGESDAASVGRVAFGDINGDGMGEIIVGWQYLTDSDGSYDIYALEGGRAVSKYTGLYTRFTLLEEDDYCALVVMSRNAVTKSVTASLVALHGGAIGLVNTVAMNSRSASYLSVTAGRTTVGRPAVYVDEQLEGGQCATEVLVIGEQGRLTNELLTQQSAATIRVTPVYCQDVNHDGIPEIPLEEALPAYTRKGVEENLYLIHWNAFDGQQLNPVSHAFVDTTEQFSLSYPEDWYGKVTVERSADNNRSFLFKSMEGELLFTIRVYGLSEYSEALGREGWRKLYSDSDHIYTVYCEPENSLNIGYTKVYSLFNVIS